MALEILSDALPSHCPKDSWMNLSRFCSDAGFDKNTLSIDSTRDETFLHSNASPRCNISSCVALKKLQNISGFFANIE